MVCRRSYRCIHRTRIVAALAACAAISAAQPLPQLDLDPAPSADLLRPDLAETIRASAELSSEPLPIPDLGMFRADRERILEQTEHFLEVEKEDQRELKRLEKELRDVRDTTAWQLVVRLMQHDNAKHQMILEFIRDRARHPL